MKATLVGLGTFGAGWYERLRSHPALSVAVIDADSSRQEILEAGTPFYTSLEAAIEAEQPDFLVNATPPHIHTEVNLIAVAHHLPVLCEKPIAEEYDEAVSVVRRASEEGIPFMVAENYRRAAMMRKVKALLGAGTIGALRSLHGEVYRGFYTEKPYFLAMKHPFLVDVAVHHLDLIRFFSSSEGRRLFARSYHPKESWHSGNLGLNLWMEMENGVEATLVGSLDSRGRETAWLGNWRLEGTDGTLHIRDERIIVEQGGVTTVVDDFGTVSTAEPLDDFLRWLAGEGEVETDGPDYLKTQALVHWAEVSVERGQVVAVELPTL